MGRWAPSGTPDRVGGVRARRYFGFRGLGSRWAYAVVCTLVARSADNYGPVALSGWHAFEVEVKARQPHLELSR